MLSAGHARALLGVDDPARQDALAARVVAEGISVRGLEELVAVGADADGTAEDGPAAPVSAPGWPRSPIGCPSRFETRCKVDLGRRKGKITVEFASLDDLQRILALMDPEGT